MGKHDAFFTQQKTKVERTSVRPSENFVFNLGACLKKENFQARSYNFFYPLYIYVYIPPFVLLIVAVGAGDVSLRKTNIVFESDIFAGPTKPSQGHEKKKPPGLIRGRASGNFQNLPR